MVQSPIRADHKKLNICFLLCSAFATWSSSERRSGVTFSEESNLFFFLKSIILPPSAAIIPLAVEGGKKGEKDMKNKLHNAILDKLRQERQVVTLFTTNGFQMKGRIITFDETVVVMEIRKEQQIVYRHAISTIAPAEPVDLDTLREEGA